MRLEDEQQFWEAYAKHDPLWAILSDPSRQGRKWDLPSFLETGTREISLLLEQLRRLGSSPKKGRALDFGCGVGRLSQALAEHFDAVVGVDISLTMLALADRLNAFGNRVAYVHNAAPDLRAFADASFDFIYTDIVLQHLEPALSTGYLAEFFRLLSPDGVLVFQLPSHKVPAESQASRPREMPPGAYAHRLALAIAPDGVAPETSIDLDIEVTNESALDWQQDQTGAIRAGNHWLDATGTRMLIQDDGRTQLPRQVVSGQRCEIRLSIISPADPGRYVCEVDLVHEGISWFGDKGAQTLRFVCDVRATSGRGSESAQHAALSRRTPRVDDEAFYRLLPAMTSPPGEFPMHGVPSYEVLDLAERYHATLVDREIDGRGGAEWRGYRYVFKLTSPR